MVIFLSRKHVHASENKINDFILPHITAKICLLNPTKPSNFTTNMIMRFEVLKAVTVKVAVFWDVTPRGLVDCYQCF
jgi:hypothetical protein